mmetsp:Transcript_69059/g.202176  ORF Transcript_69059/g.202176 Transcript_69059/m.202176 type:complete len:206 (-) Transcript_69059:670-1287(-)
MDPAPVVALLPSSKLARALRGGSGGVPQLCCKRQLAGVDGELGEGAVAAEPCRWAALHSDIDLRRCERLSRTSSCVSISFASPRESLPAAREAASSAGRRQRALRAASGRRGAAPGRRQPQAGAPPPPARWKTSPLPLVPFIHGCRMAELLESRSSLSVSSPSTKCFDASAASKGKRRYFCQFRTMSSTPSVELSLKGRKPYSSS